MKDNTGSVAYLADQIDEELSARIFCLSIRAIRAMPESGVWGVERNIS